jgi:hypothetical protein
LYEDAEILKLGELQVNAGGCSLLSEGVTVGIRDHYLYSVFILTYILILDSHFCMNT